jgi:hypothetical protein
MEDCECTRVSVTEAPKSALAPLSCRTIDRSSSRVGAVYDAMTSNVCMMNLGAGYHVMRFSDLAAHNSIRLSQSLQVRLQLLLVIILQLMRKQLLAAEVYVYRYTPLILVLSTFKPSSYGKLDMPSL